MQRTAAMIAEVKKLVEDGLLGCDEKQKLLFEEFEHKAENVRTKAGK